ncbi:MAG: filamentous hemagglutinin N-terminal domain-containing protein [Succinivibrio sp.]
MYKLKDNKHMKLSILSVSVLCSLAISANAATVLPTGEIIMHGNASVIRSDRTMLINSTTARNVISWDDFSVGRDHSVVIDSNSYLNLVRSSNPSVIDGNILSTGKGSFYLVNPNGISVGSTGSVRASNVVLSTSKITENNVKSYLDTGDFEIKHQGMGKVGLIGGITSDNIVIDGSQIIIRDVANIKRETPVFSGTDDAGSDILKLYSSVKRIDVGVAAGVDLESKLGIGRADGLVDHTGQIAVSDASEFMKISQGMNESYFITNDINLGTIDTAIGENRVFTGSIDGAFNSVSYTLNADGSTTDNLGLFSKMQDATVENLKITASSATVSVPSDSLSVGALAGSMTNTTLRNVEVDDYSVSFTNPGNAKVYAGALVGSIKGSGSILENVASGFSSETEQRLLSRQNYTSGAIAGFVNANVTQTGDVFAKISDDRMGTVGFNTSASVFDNQYSGRTDNFVYADGSYQNKGFLCPFFVDSDISIEYDADNPVSYDYGSFVSSIYYDPAYYVSVNYDYSGAIEDPDIYSHTYSSLPVGTTFYFVKTDDNGQLLTGGKMQHYVSVTDNPVPVSPPAEAGQSPSFDWNYDLIFADRLNYDLFVSDKKAELALSKNFQKEQNSRFSRNSKLSFYNRTRLVDVLMSPSLLSSLNLENEEYQLAKGKDDSSKKNGSRA